MTLRTMLACLPLAAALAAAPAAAADMPAGYAGRAGAGFSAGWAPPPPPPPVALEAEVQADILVAAPPPRRLLGFGYAPVLPYYGVSTGPYGYPPRREPGVGVAAVLSREPLRHQRLQGPEVAVAQAAASQAATVLSRYSALGPVGPQAAAMCPAIASSVRRPA